MPRHRKVFASATTWQAVELEVGFGRASAASPKPTVGCVRAPTNLHVDVSVLKLLDGRRHT